MMRTLALATMIVVGWTSAARAAPLADSHTLFLNNCQPNGCVVHAGSSNATTDTSSAVTKAGTIAAFNQGATVWASVVSCLKTVMSPFDLTVTEQRPAQGPYFEVIIAGTGTDVGEPSDLGALGETPCTSVGQCVPFASKAVGFAFANAAFYANKPNEICGAAAQSIALSWALDHVVDASDVMTFNSYTGTPSFHDAEACGSDCIGGRSPFGLLCTGTNDATATHACVGSNQATQNEIQTLLALFGPAPALPDGGVDGGQSDGGVDGGQSDGDVDGLGSTDAGGAGGASGADAAITDARVGDAPVAASDGGRDAGNAGVSGACAVNADCALGHYCDATVKMCTFDCRAAADCATGTTCNSLGMCVARAATSSGGGCGCRVGDGSGPAPAPGLALLIALAALRLTSRRRHP